MKKLKLKQKKEKYNKIKLLMRFNEDDRWKNLYYSTSFASFSGWILPSFFSIKIFNDVRKLIDLQIIFLSNE